MNANNKKALTILQNIKKNIDKKNFCCLYGNCNQPSINSHLLQKNGVLNLIAEKNHLIQIKLTDLFKIEKDGFVQFKKLGIDQAISYPIFCNVHDTTIFKLVETPPINYFDYKAQLLLSYRSTCAELRKKERNIELNKRLIAANSLRGLVSKKFWDVMTRQKLGNELGVIDLNYFKEEFENEIESPAGNFIFKVCRFPFIQLSISAIFSYHRTNQRDNSDSLSPLNTIFVNVIPLLGELVVILGYHKEKCDSLILDYINSWSKCDSSNFTQMLSDLTTRVESWVMSESLFKSIPIKLLEKYKQNFVELINLPTVRYYSDIDLFGSK